MLSGSPPGVPIALHDALEDADTMGVLIADFGRFFGCAFGYAFMRGSCGSTSGSPSGDPIAPNAAHEDED